MLRQYGAQRHRLVPVGGIKRPVGTVPIGTIRKLNPKEPVIVLGWLPREVAAVKRNFRKGPDGHVIATWESRYYAYASFLAVCRSLRTGRYKLVSDVWLRDPDE